MASKVPSFLVSQPIPSSHDGFYSFWPELTQPATKYSFFYPFLQPKTIDPIPVRLSGSGDLAHPIPTASRPNSCRPSAVAVRRQLPDRPHRLPRRLQHAAMGAEQGQKYRNNFGVILLFASWVRSVTWD